MKLPELPENPEKPNNIVKIHTFYIIYEQPYGTSVGQIMVKPNKKKWHT